MHIHYLSIVAVQFERHMHLRQGHGPWTQPSEITFMGRENSFRLMRLEERKLESFWPQESPLTFVNPSASGGSCRFLPTALFRQVRVQGTQYPGVPWWGLG